MGKINNSKKVTKARKGLQIGPRLRLEPRLTPKHIKKTQDKEETKDSPEFFKTNEIGETSCLAMPSYDSTQKVYEQDSEAFKQECEAYDQECETYEQECETYEQECETYEKDCKISCIVNNSPVTKKNINQKNHSQSMCKIKNSKKTTKTSKKLQVGPRLRLEPRLTPKCTKKTQDEQETKDNPKFSKINEMGEASSLATSSYDSTEKNYEQEWETSCLVNNNSAGEENINQETCTSVINNQASGDENDEEPENKVKKPRKALVQKSVFWNDKELMDLATGLQNEGFADLKKVAEYVKTKNENDINFFLKKRYVEARKKEHSNRPGGKRNTWNTISPENIATWPNVRKWRKLAYDQMLSHIRSKDYSKQVILALCKKFYEEEKEPADPQVINVKMIYKYMMDCMSGEIPAQLPPKESALVLDLLREVRLMPLTYDFEEELKFLNGFKEATKFKPFQVKDEFKKRFKKELDEEAVNSNTIPVPEEVFMDLSRHKKLIQSFNPLVTPIWMLQKEQEIVEKYFEESNVYVD